MNISNAISKQRSNSIPKSTQKSSSSKAELKAPSASEPNQKDVLFPNAQSNPDFHSNCFKLIGSKHLTVSITEKNYPDQFKLLSRAFYVQKQRNITNLTIQIAFIERAESIKDICLLLSKILLNFASIKALNLELTGKHFALNPDDIEQFSKILSKRYPHINKFSINFGHWMNTPVEKVVIAVSKYIQLNSRSLEILNINLSQAYYVVYDDIKRICTALRKTPRVLKSLALIASTEVFPFYLKHVNEVFMKRWWNLETLALNGNSQLNSPIHQDSPAFDTWEYRTETLKCLFNSLLTRTVNLKSLELNIFSNNYFFAESEEQIRDWVLEMAKRLDSLCLGKLPLELFELKAV